MGGLIIDVFLSLAASTHAPVYVSMALILSPCIMYSLELMAQLLFTSVCSDGSSLNRGVVVDASEVGNVTRMINHYAKAGSTLPLRLPSGVVAKKNAMFEEVRVFWGSWCSSSQCASDHFGAHTWCMYGFGAQLGICNMGISNVHVHRPSLAALVGHLEHCLHECHCSPFACTIL